MLLAQITAGNNSDKLKNEIRQILYKSCITTKESRKICGNLIKPLQ